jgi:hypothetical protein
MMPVLIGVVLAVATACGGNGNGDETASGRAIEPEAQQRAESINLTLADFPDGWRASAPEQGDSGREELNRCLGVDYSELTIIGEDESQDFATGDSTEASSDVTVFKDEQQAEDAMRQFSEGMGGSGAEDCFQNLVEEAVKEGGSETDRFKLGEVDVGELSFTPPDVEEGKAWQVVVPVEITEGAGKGFEPNVYVEAVVLREGDAITFLATEDVLTEFDRELRDELAQTLASRMSESVT